MLRKIIDRWRLHVIKRDQNCGLDVDGDICICGGIKYYVDILNNEIRRIDEPVTKREKDVWKKMGKVIRWPLV